MENNAKHKKKQYDHSWTALKQPEPPSIKLPVISNQSPIL